MNKKWLFLLALPCWVIVESTSAPKYLCDQGLDTIGCYLKKESCEDMAEALNEAHEKRRLKKSHNETIESEIKELKEMED